MRRNLLYLFAAFLFVSIGINILVHLQNFIAFLPESAVFGPQVPVENTKSRKVLDKKRDSEGQSYQYSNHDLWEYSKKEPSSYTNQRVKSGRYNRN